MNCWIAVVFKPLALLSAFGKWIAADTINGLTFRPAFWWSAVKGRTPGYQLDIFRPSSPNHKALPYSPGHDGFNSRCALLQTHLSKVQVHIKRHAWETCPRMVNVPKKRGTICLFICRYTLYVHMYACVAPYTECVHFLGNFPLQRAPCLCPMHPEVSSILQNLIVILASAKWNRC